MAEKYTNVAAYHRKLAARFGRKCFNQSKQDIGEYGLDIEESIMLCQITSITSQVEDYIVFTSSNDILHRTYCTLALRES